MVNNSNANKKIQEYGKILASLHEFASEKIIPGLANSRDLSRAESALEAQYGQLYIWVEVLLQVIKQPLYFGIVLTGTRTIFELHLDIHILKAKKPSDVSKFFGFVNTAGFRAIQKAINTAKNENLPFDEWLSYFKKIIDHPSLKRRKESTAARLWGYKKQRGKRRRKINWPDHWTGKSPLERARDLGPEFIKVYLRIYSPTCWCIHANPVVVVGKPVDYLVNLAAVGCVSTCQMFKDSTDVVLKHMRAVRSKRLQKEFELLCHRIYQGVS